MRTRKLASRAFATLLVMSQALAEAPLEDDRALGEAATATASENFSETYRDGHCEVVRSWRKGSEYNEQRTCKVAPSNGHAHAANLLRVPFAVPPRSTLMQPLL